jgi:KDO2-lipid IV(A) lauroyltransferase
LAKLLFGDKRKARSQRLLNVLWATEAGLLGLLVRIGRWLPPDTASRIGAWLGHRLGPGMDKTRLIQRNLRLAFPQKSDAELDQLVVDIWANLGSILAEYPHLGTICHTEAEQRLEFVIPDSIEVFKNPAKPAVFVSAHLANWELAAGAIVQQGVPLSVVYTRLQNPVLDRMLNQARGALGCGLIEREGAARQLIRCLKQGTSVGLIVDQRVDGGEPVPFFGHNMRTSITPAQLALRFDCELIPVQIQRLTGARFRVIFHPSVTADDETAPDDRKVLQMTAKINDLFESWIRERPQEWMCTKRRWPKNLVKPDWIGRPDPEA